MSRNILVTVGVSLVRDDIARKERLRVGFESLPSPFYRLDDLQERLRAQDNDQREHDASPFNVNEPIWAKARAACIAALKRLWTQDILLTDQERYRYSGAELASLMRLGKAEITEFAPLSGDDKVFLLASDTPSGMFCARLLRDVIAQGGLGGLPAVDQVLVEPVLGLRPFSSELFLAQGLPNAAKLLFTYSQPGQRALLMGSGGYKGLLPYLAPIAMVREVPLLYLYEESEELLALRSLPLRLDLDLIRRHDSAFGLIWPIPDREERTVVRAAEFWAAVDHKNPADKDDLMASQWIQVNDDRLKLTASGVVACLLAKAGQEPGLDAEYAYL